MSLRMVTVVEMENIVSKNLQREESRQGPIDDSPKGEGHVANKKAEESKDLGV